MALILALIVAMIAANLILFASIIIKKLLRDTFVAYQKRAEKHYQEWLTENLAAGNPLDLPERERLKNRAIIEGVLRTMMKKAHREEKDTFKELFARWGYQDYHLAQLTKRDPLERAYAAEILGAFQVEQARDELIKRLNDPVGYVRSTAARALGKIGGKKAAAALKKWVR